MENAKLNGKEIIIDEQLEHVSGGADMADGLPKRICENCKKNIFAGNITMINNRAICKDCKEKLGI